MLVLLQVSLDNGQLKVPEPNADYFGKDEGCVGANFTQSYAGTWGWSDVGCGTLGPALCKLPPPGNFTYDSAAADGRDRACTARVSIVLNSTAWCVARALS